MTVGLPAVGVPEAAASAAPGTPPPRRPANLARGDTLTAWVFIAPQLIGVLAFVIYPLVAVAWFSLNEWRILGNTFRFVGLENYTRLMSDPSFAESLQATAIFSVGLVAFNVSLALLLAVLLNQRIPGTTTFRTLFFSPVVVSLVAWSIVWGFLLQNDGGINGALATIGIEGPNWLREGPTAMLAVIVVQVFKNVGLNMILFLAALQTIPEETVEAARLDGAGPWRIFRSITVPLISPQILLVMIITVVGSLEVFAQIAVLTNGGPGNSTTVLVYYLYQQAFQYNSFGYASAIAMVLFAIVLALTLLQWRARKAWVHNEV